MLTCEQVRICPQRLSQRFNVVQADISLAIAANKQAMAVCAQQRKQFSLAEQMIGRLTETTRGQQMSEC